MTVEEPPALTIPPPDWLARPGVRPVYDAIGNGRFVGGAVRDTLLGRPIGDVDLATPSPPDETVNRLQAARIRALATGIPHGTVTALLDGQVIEVTSLRRDVETDGRHAVVAFGADWGEDAARRDFTMNALYLDIEGRIWDPLRLGVDDCRAGRVRFVGAPRQRITEDRLRLLRFYRFQAHYGRTDADPAARAACRAMAGDLAKLPGERIHREVFRLLEAPDPVATIRLMIEDGVLGQILPVPANPDRLARLIAIEPKPSPIRRLAALLPPGTADVPRLRLSNQEKDCLAALSDDTSRADLAAAPNVRRQALYRLGSDGYTDRVLLQAAALESPPPVAPLLDLARHWTPPKLPITGSDVIDLGVPPGPHLGDLLRAVEQWWVDRDFRPDRPACLAELARLVKGG